MRTWIITADEHAQSLVEAARNVGSEVVAVVCGEAHIGGVDSILRVACPENTPVEALAPLVAESVEAAPGDVVLVANRPAERVLAGAVAAKLNAPVFTGVLEIGTGKAKLSVYGGISVEEVSFTSAVIAILDGGAESEGKSPESAALSGQTYAASVTSVERQDVAQVNLSAAKRIVAAGRGFKDEGDLNLARALCEVLGAELACSRPLAEGTNWLARDRYVGVSGQVVSPDLYVAVGISGQVQHTAGMNDSALVVAINDDEKAPIFEVADYGIVGDLYSVLPALTAALS